MNCEELMSIRQIRQGMKLIAGERGMHHNIRWIYFADCTTCLNNEFDLSEFIYGEELVIITNQSITNDDNKILSMISTMNEKKVAGLAINEGQISKKVIGYCNENDLPLFELSIKLHLVDFSHTVCRALVEEESNANSRERILSTILYSNELNVADIKEQADYFGVDLSEKQRVVMFKIDETGKKSNKLSKADEGKLIELRENVQRIIRNEFKDFGLTRALMLWQVNKSVVLIPSDFFSRDLLETILKNIMKHIRSRCHVEVKCGVGMPHEYMDEFKNSYHEAKNSLDIFGNMNKEKDIFFYENLGIYSIIAQISNEKFLADYVESRIGSLIKADQMQEGELCETLEAYLDNNCNSNATAEILYIHRNTMRYRMDKIKKILNNDINELSAYMELKLAFAIRRYLENK